MVSSVLRMAYWPGKKTPDYIAPIKEMDLR